MDTGLTIKEDLTDESDFKRLSWPQLFKLYDKDFDLKTAYQTENEIRRQIHFDEQPSYLLFPAEGDCETEALKHILSQITELYGNSLVNYYYCLYKTKDWEDDIVYSGFISEFEKLRDKNDIRENPTAVYPNNKEWCIVSNIDLPFTYIGGTKDLIDRIISNNDFGIFRIEPLFRANT